SLVAGIPDVGGIKGAGETVLGTEYGVQGDSGNRGQDVNGATPLRVKTSLIGNQANPLPGLWGDVKNVEIVLFQNVNASFDDSIADGRVAGPTLGFVIPGDAFPAHLFFFAHCKRKSCRNRRGQLAAQRYGTSFSPRMHRIGK